MAGQNHSGGHHSISMILSNHDSVCLLCVKNQPAIHHRDTKSAEKRSKDGVSSALRKIPSLFSPLAPVQVLSSSRVFFNRRKQRKQSSGTPTLVGWSVPSPNGVSSAVRKVPSPFSPLAPVQVLNQQMSIGTSPSIVVHYHVISICT